MRPIEEAGKNGRFQRHDVLSDKSRFQLCPDDHRGRVWRSLGQRADPAFTIARHTYPQPELIAWGAISFDSRTLWLSLEHTYSTVVRRRHSENCFATVTLAAHKPHFSTRYCQTTSVHVAMTVLQLVKHFLGQPDLSPIKHV
ncbi:transposable element Tc1 transposase [Trichonephila clavipes]|nr:transposable element Tc1 transposase [Trichonephila clavipes]